MSPDYSSIIFDLTKSIIYSLLDTHAFVFVTLTCDFFCILFYYYDNKII
jgi:hypothetical protein